MDPLLPMHRIRQQIVMVTNLKCDGSRLRLPEIDMVAAGIPSCALFRAHFRNADLPSIKITESSDRIQVVMQHKRTQRRELPGILLFPCDRPEPLREPLVTNKAFLPFANTCGKRLTDDPAGQQHSRQKRQIFFHHRFLQSYAGGRDHDRPVQAKGIFSRQDTGDQVGVCFADPNACLAKRNGIMEQAVQHGMA